MPSDERVLYGTDLWTDMILDAAEPLSLYDYHPNIVCQSWAAIVGVINGTAMIRGAREFQNCTQRGNTITSWHITNL